MRRACGRLPSIHSVPEAFPPLPRHILFFRSSMPSESLQPLPVPPESVPFKVACFLHDDELPWAMANPNRILSRLALQYNSKNILFEFHLKDSNFKKSKESFFQTTAPQLPIIQIVQLCFRLIPAPAYSRYNI